MYRSCFIKSDYITFFVADILHHLSVWNEGDVISLATYLDVCPSWMYGGLGWPPPFAYSLVSLDFRFGISLVVNRDGASQ